MVIAGFLVFVLYFIERITMSFYLSLTLDQSHKILPITLKNPFPKPPQPKPISPVITPVTPTADLKHPCSLPLLLDLLPIDIPKTNCTSLYLMNMKQLSINRIFLKDDWTNNENYECKY